MPVQQKGPSEYQRNYTWHQSRKSRSYSPPLEMLKPAAGVTSNIAAKNLKPAITTKKKVEDIDGKLKTSTEIPKEDEYILLGTNEKFASNVQYRSKSRDRAMNLLKKSKTQPVENGQVKTPLAPRQLAPAPKVKYDPGAPKLRTTTKPTKTEPEKLQKATETQNGEALPKKSALKQVQKSVMKPQNVEAIKSKGQPEKSKQQAVKEKKLANNAKENRPPTAAVSMQKKEQREKKRGKLHESVQTDLEKGVAYSHQEAPADYALRYKAGLVPPRSRVGPKRVSEYALQYQWRKGVPSSPLLAAEQIVYKSNPQAPPFRPDTMAKASEYNHQFKPWHMLKSTPNLNVAAGGGAKPPKAGKLKRSKSLEDVGPDQRPAAGGESLVNAEDKRLVKESLNPQKLQFPHGKFKRQRSEYASNFAPPQKFEYEEGAWRGADPPQLIQRPESADDEVRPKSWYNEVVELRRKAQEYKKRALGTHFSRTHLAQLYAQQADMWDVQSTAGVSTVSALSLETPKSIPSVPSSRRSSQREAWSAASIESPLMGTVTPDSQRTLTPVGSVDQNGVDFSDDGFDEVDEDVATVTESEMSVRQVKVTAAPHGRIPTPKLHAQKSRHHLDRTTPASGGAILTSPPLLDNASEQSLEIVSKPKKPKKYKPTPVAHAVRETIPGPSVHPKNQRPTFGKPTADTHALLDEDTASDHTLRLNFVKTQPQVDKERKELQTRLSTIKELSGEYKSTQNTLPQKGTLTVDDIPERPATEDDAMSLSALSIASSCSLASEVLERAKNRRDQFWNDGN